MHYETNKKGISKVERGCRRSCNRQLPFFCVYRIVSYANGLSTARHGSLHVTGSYRSNGVSGFSFKGVYRAPMGTTSREASLTDVSSSQPWIQWCKYHARAWESIPAESDAIAVLHLTPLVLQSVVVHIAPTCLIQFMGCELAGSSVALQMGFVP